MRVICIKSDSKVVRGSSTVPNGSIKEGYIYTVIDTITFKDKLYYLLLEAKGCGYWSKLFIPLSDIDEATFERNYKTEPV